jgi:hypothetical protein
MKVSRAVVLLDKMPKLSIEEITKEEALELLDFLNAKPSYLTTNMARLRLADEMNVNKEALDEALGDMSVIEGLVMECENTGGSITLEEVHAYFTGDEEVELLKMCALLNPDEGELVWRWVFRHRWGSIKSKLSKWVCGLFGDCRHARHETVLRKMIKQRYSGVMTIDELNDTMKRKPRLLFWVSALVQPDKWWFLQDGSTLRWLDNQDDELVARQRSDDVIDIEMTERARENKSKSAWCWLDEDGYFCDEESNTISDWDKAIALLQLYPRGMILIHRDDAYHYQSAANVTLYTQILAVRKKQDSFEFRLGCKDGVSVVDVDSFELQHVPFPLEQVFKMDGVRYNYGRDWHNVGGCVVVATSPIWNPEEGWRMSYLTYDSEKGMSDISDIVDYQNIMRVNNE